MTRLKEKHYDVIIVGAAFAGLAVAGKIKAGKVLLIDAKPIGSAAKSACGTILDVITKLKLEHCVLQRHEKMVLHLGKKTFTYHLSSPFCVIDGGRLFKKLFEGTRAEFLQAKAQSFDGHVLKTDKGTFQADIFVDASGPRAILSGRKNKYLSFGLETIVDYKEEGLHFWYEPKIFPKGVFWIFPRGKVSGVGVGSYIGRTDILPELKGFLKRFDLKLNKKTLHGGYFAHRLQDPVSGKVFLVGDAAGQCIAITGEGIRPAIFFGQKLGEIITLIVKGRITHQEGIAKYRRFVFKGRKFKYETLYWGQKLLTNAPQPLFGFIAGILSRKSSTNFVLEKYLRILK